MRTTSADRQATRIGRRHLLKGAAIASATGAIIGLEGGTAAAGLSLTTPGVHYATYAGAHFRQHHSSVAQANYWDNGSIYGIRVGEGRTGFAIRLDLPDGSELIEAVATLRFNSGDAPVTLSILGFDIADGFQIVGQGQVNEPTPDLVRSVALDLTTTNQIDNERFSYLLRWRPSHLETVRRDRPDAPEQLLWGFRIGYRGRKI